MLLEVVPDDDDIVVCEKPDRCPAGGDGKNRTGRNGILCNVGSVSRQPDDDRSA